MDLKVDFEGRDLAQTPQGWVVPITGAEDPVAAYRRCVAEFVG